MTVRSTRSSRAFNEFFLFCQLTQHDVLISPTIFTPSLFLSSFTWTTVIDHWLSGEEVSGFLSTGQLPLVARLAGHTFTVAPLAESQSTTDTGAVRFTEQIMHNGTLDLSHNISHMCSNPPFPPYLSSFENLSSKYNLLLRLNCFNTINSIILHTSNCSNSDYSWHCNIALCCIAVCCGSMLAVAEAKSCAVAPL